MFSTYPPSGFVVVQVHQVSSSLGPSWSRTSILRRRQRVALHTSGVLRGVHKHLGYSNAMPDIIITAAPFPTTILLFPFPLRLTSTITKISHPTSPADCVYDTGRGYRVYEPSLTTSCHEIEEDESSYNKAFPLCKTSPNITTNLPMFITSPKTDEEFVVEQFQRSFSNCLWHSVIPKLAPSLSVGIRSGLFSHTFICCEDKPGTP